MEEKLRKKANTLFYFMTKTVARDSFSEFLDSCELTKDEWKEIKKELETLGITDTYI